MRLDGQMKHMVCFSAGMPKRREMTGKCISFVTANKLGI
jgi:hypothetical protein